MADEKTIRDRIVKSEGFTMGDTPVQDSILNSELTDCKIRNVDAACIAMYCSRFMRCHFEFAKQANELNCQSCQLVDCTFTGRFYGCCFGMPLDSEFSCPFKPLMQSCDFSRCVMHYCSFFYADLATIQFPTWPHFTVIDPLENREDWLEIPFPDSFRTTQEGMTNGQGRFASIMNWHWFAKKKGEPKELPDSLREILQSKSYIRM